ncbi:MAG: multiheme c-type cytochrome [Vicinamibacterales bacterium]
MKPGAQSDKGKPPAGEGTGTSTRLLFVAVILGFVVSALVMATTYEPEVPEHLTDARPVQLREDGYISSQACQSCHPNEYATWRASYHRSMTQVATPETVKAHWDGVVADVHGRPMRLRQDGRRFFAEFDNPDWDGQGEVAPRIEREVVMITGSHHQQIYWYATGQDRLLGQLPGAYLVPEQRWIPRRMAVLHPPTDPVYSETGHWNSTCIACHTTNGKPHFSTPFGSEPLESQDIQTTVAEFGISCEACHGPGEEHVRLNRNPLRRYGLHLGSSRDDTMVQPALLPPERSSQVCGQCHGIWEFYDSGGERLANSRGLPFRPGDVLSDTRFLAQPTVNGDSPTMKMLLEVDSSFMRDSFWADGKVKVSGREYNGLLESPCYFNATDDARKMSCFSCHVLHKTPDDARPAPEWAEDQLAPGMRGDLACTQCHAPIAQDIQAHTRHPVGSSGSSCYNCHMPYTTYGLLKTIRSHTVSSPTVVESSEIGRPNACNLCHLDKTLEWTGEKLNEWYGTPLVELTDDQRNIAASFLWALTGDAGQRAVATAALGWEPAQEASGTDWMPPLLAELINDPYDAVRFGAGRSLATLPGFENFEYDFVAGPQTRYQKQLETMRVWDRSRAPGRDGVVLMTSDGTLDVQTFLRLLKQRNTRRVLLRE